MYCPTNSSLQLLVGLEIIRRQGECEPRLHIRSSGRDFADLLAQHGGVIPGEAELGVRCESPQHAKSFGAVVVIEEEDISFFPFHECQHIDVSRHDSHLLLAARAE